MKLIILLAVGITVAYSHSRGEDHTKAPIHGDKNPQTTVAPRAGKGKFFGFSAIPPKEHGEAEVHELVKEVFHFKAMRARFPDLVKKRLTDLSGPSGNQQIREIFKVAFDASLNKEQQKQKVTALVKALKAKDAEALSKITYISFFQYLIRRGLDEILRKSNEAKEKKQQISELTASLLSVAVEAIDPEVYKLAKPILEDSGSLAEKKEELNDIIDSLPSYQQKAAFDGFSKYIETEQSIYNYFAEHADSLKNEKVKTAIEVFIRVYTNQHYTRAERYKKVHKYLQHFLDQDWEDLQDFVREKLIKLQKEVREVQYNEKINPPERFEVPQDKHIKVRWTQQAFLVARKYLRPFLAGVSGTVLDRFVLEAMLQERKAEEEQKKKLQLLIARMPLAQRPVLRRALDEWTHINYLLNDFVVRKIAALPESVVKTAAEDIALAQLSPHISGKELSAKLGEIEKSLSTADREEVRLTLRRYVQVFGHKLAKWLEANPSTSHAVKRVTADDFNI